MGRRFRKKAGLVGAVSLPGMTGVGNDEVVEGDEYARFCPAVLEEVLDEEPKKAKPKKKAKPAPPPPPPAEKEPEEEPDETDEDPSMEWLKADLVEYAEARGLDVDGMTKREILDAIEAA